MLEDEAGGARGRGDVARLVEHPAGDGEPGDRQAVPGGQDLLVAQRRRAPRAHGVERRPRVGQRGPFALVGARDVQDVLPLEVAAGRDAVVGDEALGDGAARRDDSSISCSDQTKNSPSAETPSAPSESASVAEKKPPSGAVISRTR